MFNNNLLIAFSISALLAGNALSAAIITPYSSQPLYSAAVSGYPSVTDNFNTNSTTFYNITFNGGGGGFSGGQLFDTAISPNQFITIAPLSGSNMIGLGATWDLSPGGAGSGLTITINLVGGGSQTLTNILGVNTGNFLGPFFFGFTSDVAFSSVLVKANGGTEAYNMDNLQSATVLPEPATYGVLAGFLALVVMQLGLRRKRVT